LPDGRSGRLARIDFVPQVEDDVDDNGEQQPQEEPAQDPTLVRPGSGLHTATLLVARERQTLDAQISRLRWSFALFTGLLLGTLVGLVALALKIGLRPLERLARQVKGLDAESLDQRVGAEAPPRELLPVVEQLNELLARLETAFRRERQLTADIAHELKTPIAELRNLCEVGGRWPDDTATAQRFFEDAWVIALQMERIVIHLLALARYDEGKEVVESGRVAVARACEDAWRPFAAQARERGLELRNLVPGDAILETDPGKLRLILSNLLSNAVEYSRPESPVICELHQSNGVSSLSVSNYVANLDAHDVPVMFDRFWRKDAARGGGRNVGLGLSIVRAFSDLLEYDLETQLRTDGLLRITLSERQVLSQLDQPFG
jgi:two-component system sensor histidine kinase QseC